MDRLIKIFFINVINKNVQRSALILVGLVGIAMIVVAFLNKKENKIIKEYNAIVFIGGVTITVSILIFFMLRKRNETPRFAFG